MLKRPSLWPLSMWITAGLLMAASAVMAQRNPYIGFVYPAGGRQGSTFQAAISGQYLMGLTNAVISGEGVQATIVEHVRPFNGRELNLMRDRLRNMQKGLATAKKTDSVISFQNEMKTNEVLKLSRGLVEAEIAELRQKLANPKNQRPPNPQLSEDITLRVVVATNAAPGWRELRLRTAAGLSNPVKFQVGILSEYSQKPDVCLAGPNSPNVSDPTRFRRLSVGEEFEQELRVSLPAVVNGQIMPGDVDRIRFTGRTGQKLVITVSARELMPYLADAVPGWFQAVIGLYDSKGNELAYDDDFRFNPDPVIYYEVPKDGEYVLVIHDSIYRGREDFVYRITIGELPFITGIFPLGGKVGQTSNVELKGWNLPSDKLEVSPKASGLHQLTVNKDKSVSNPMPFSVDTLPEALDREANDSQGAAQKVAFPVIVNGRIGKSGDVDVFSFQGTAGSEVIAEVQARRLNSPLDSVIKLTDAAGKVLASNDDFEDKSAGLTTHQADSQIAFTLPSDGTYYAHVADTQNKGGQEYSYRLRISQPRPDFALRITPSSISARSGSSFSTTIYALQKDGFSNDIMLVLKDAPPGFRLSNTRIPADTNMVRLTLYAPSSLPDKPVAIKIEGRAIINGKPVVHEAVPAEDMMQAFAYRHLVPSQDLLVSVGRGFSGKKSGQFSGSKKTSKK